MAGQQGPPGPPGPQGPKGEQGSTTMVLYLNIFTNVICHHSGDSGCSFLSGPQYFTTNIYQGYHIKKIGEFRPSPNPEAMQGHGIQGTSGGTIVTVNPGAYLVNQTRYSTTSDNYTTTYSEGCSGTVAPGQTKTCNITEDIFHVGPSG